VEKTEIILDMALQIGSAMEYLEHNGFIHRDLVNISQAFLPEPQSVMRGNESGGRAFALPCEDECYFWSNFSVGRSTRCVFVFLFHLWAYVSSCQSPQHFGLRVCCVNFQFSMSLLLATGWGSLAGRYRRMGYWVGQPGRLVEEDGLVGGAL